MSARRICEPFPAPSVPVLQPPDSVAPDINWAVASKGDDEGNDVPEMAVDVWSNESTLTKRIDAPTGTLVIAGLKPPLLPYGVLLTTDDVSETSIVVEAGPVLPPPAEGAPGVQLARAVHKRSAKTRTNHPCEEA